MKKRMSKWEREAKQKKDDRQAQVRKFRRAFVTAESQLRTLREDLLAANLSDQPVLKFDGVVVRAVANALAEISKARNEARVG